MTTRSSRRLLASLLAAAAITLSGCAAEKAFRQGEHESEKMHWDVAVMAYEKAAALDPQNGKYKIALGRAKLRAGLTHLSRGRLHRAAGQLDLAQVELEQAVALDPTNDSALEELKRVVADVEQRRLEVAGGVTPTEQAKAKARGARVKPPMLSPSSDKPIDVTFPADSSIKKIYQTLCSAAGINVIYDPQLKDDKFSIDLRGMTFQKALETAMRQAGHFYKVIDERTILVAQDTQQNRKEYEDLVIRTFFLSNGDVKDVSAMVRSILDLRRMGTIPQLNAIVIRDTADKVAVAERLIEVNDKAKAEVVVDVELLQLLTRKLLDLGASLSSYSIGITPITTPVSDTSGKPVSGTILWSDLIANGISDFSLTIPSIVVNFIKQNTDAELLAKPQLRIAEGEKATLVIGNRVPIPVTTINTQQAIGQVGVVPITSFQYQDVGIKLDIEARVHHNKEVSLKLTVEVSNLNGSVKGQNGQEQPIIATRTITSNIRLKEGETSFLAGLYQNFQSQSKVGFPFLSDIPLIGPLFTQTHTENERTDIFMTLTPHITRAPKITEEDLIPIWVGTENNVSFSGLNTRLESPSAQASPFDAPVEVPSAPRVVPPTQPLPGPAQPVPQAPTTPLPGTVLQGSGPNDPFKAATKPSTPAVPPPQVVIPGYPGPKLLATDADVPRQVALAFEADSSSLRTGDVTVVSLSASPAMRDVGSLELTVEWDATVVEVTGVAPGPWRSGTDGLNVRFDADKVPGRARLMFGTPTGVVGLPDGVLARLMVRAAGPGKAALRLSAGAALGKEGPVRPAADGVVLTVEP